MGPKRGRAPAQAQSQLTSSYPAKKARSAPGGPRPQAVVPLAGAKKPGTTLGGWMVAAAVQHLCSPACGLKALIDAHGAPGFYEDDTKDGSSLCNFRSLAKAIVYQQLAGAAASTIWTRLLALAADGQGGSDKRTTGANAGVCKRQADGWQAPELEHLTPGRCLSLGEDRLRQAGLSRQKASYILSLAEAFGQVLPYSSA